MLWILHWIYVYIIMLDALWLYVSLLVCRLNGKDTLQQGKLSKPEQHSVHAKWQLCASVAEPWLSIWLSANIIGANIGEKLWMSVTCPPLVCDVLLQFELWQSQSGMLLCRESRKGIKCTPLSRGQVIYGWILMYTDVVCCCILNRYIYVYIYMQLCIPCAFHMYCVVITTLLSAIICYKILQVYKRRASAYRVFLIGRMPCPVCYRGASRSLDSNHLLHVIHFTWCLSACFNKRFSEAHVLLGERVSWWPAIAAIGTAYKCTDAGCTTRVMYAGKAEARSCHHCLVPSLSLFLYSVYIIYYNVYIYITYIHAPSPLFFSIDRQSLCQD